MGQFPIWKLKWNLLRTSVTACTMDKNKFSVPFGIFYVKKKFENKFYKKKILYNPHRGCFPFANYRLRIGVTVIGLAEHFGHCGSHWVFRTKKVCSTDPYLENYKEWQLSFKSLELRSITIWPRGKRRKSFLLSQLHLYSPIHITNFKKKCCKIS